MPLGSLLLAMALALSAPTEGAGVDVLIAFHSQNGHTRAMAEAVAEGARALPSVRVKVKTVGEATLEDLLAAEAIVLGSPVTNANVSPEVQSYINSWPFEGQELKDKVGAAFVSAGGISAGEEAVQLALLRSMLCFGMVIVGGPHWTGAFGASAVMDEDPFEEGASKLVDERFLVKARALGGRVAEMALRMQAAPAESTSEP